MNHQLRLLLPSCPAVQVSRGAEDAKDSLKDAGSKVQNAADSSSKDAQRKADDVSKDSEGILKKVRQTSFEGLCSRRDSPICIASGTTR